jgi:hypothetical protein
MPQWTLEHSVFAYDSFVKSGESIIEIQPLFRCRFMGTFQVTKPFWGGPHLFEQEELKGAIRKQIGMINRELLERVEGNFLERLQIYILQNGHYLSDIIFHT